MIRWIGIQYLNIQMIGLGGSELNVQYWRDQIRWIGIEYLIVHMIRLGGLELNI